MSTDNPRADVFFILITCLFDIVFIWLREVLSWSLMGVTGLNKHSVVKNFNWQRETWWIGLQERTTELNLREPRKNMVSGNVKCFCLESQDKRIKLPSLCLWTFSQSQFFLFFMILQIWTSVKEITLVTWMLHARTPLDHMYVDVKLDILEMDKTAQVIIYYWETRPFCPH